jgi:hypothetical protein
MAITITPGDRQKRSGTFQDLGTYTVGTSTGQSSISLTDDVAQLTGSTATGFSVGRILLPTSGALQGQEMVVVMTSTGEVKVQMTGTATGDQTFTATSQWALYRFIDTSWKIVTSAATAATATGTA